MDGSVKKSRRLTSFQIIILGFAGVILAGALLLMLPIATQSRTVTPFNEALFTSTSAVCVTGLVVHDTATYWSLFGQSVILLMIQIGGLGVITIAVSFALLSGKKISLMQRSTMQDAFSAPSVGGIVRLTGFVLRTTFLIELAGAIALAPAFYRDFGLKGLRMALFHSVSAFCNAGFDIMGSENAKYASLTSYSADPPVNIIVILLIVTGGIGFLTWDDIRTNKFRLSRYHMQSKVILTTTAVLIVIPAVLFFFFDFADLPFRERLLSALFQSVTPRTAGFNSADISNMTESGRAIILILMLIGGSPGSTAGGMKTTTVAVLLATAIACFFRKKDPQMFGRRLESAAVKNAATILMLYLTLFTSGAFIISLVEKLPLSTCLFETASAIGTVGLTLGITPELGVVSQVILMILMFFGRVGGLTLLYAAISESKKRFIQLPQEKIAIG